MSGIKLAKSLALLALILLGLSCTSVRTHVDYDKSADFSSYAAFTWSSSDLPFRPSGSTYISPLDVQRIREAIGLELVSLGFSETVDQASADFVVSFTVGAREKIDVETYPPSYGVTWVRHWPYYGRVVDVHTYTEGTLAIDIFDVATNRPVWHGVASKSISKKDRENPNETVNAAVTAVLSNFPPP